MLLLHAALIQQLDGQRDEDLGSDGPLPESSPVKDGGVSAINQYLDASTPQFQAPNGIIQQLSPWSQ